MNTQLDLWPDHDQHVRVWRFVQEHEYQHMLWTWIDMCMREAKVYHEAMKGKRQITDAEYNVAQDYIINDLLLHGVTKQEKQRPRS